MLNDIPVYRIPCKNLPIRIYYYHVSSYQYTGPGWSGLLVNSMDDLAGFDKWLHRLNGIHLQVHMNVAPRRSIDSSLSVKEFTS